MERHERPHPGGVRVLEQRFLERGEATPAPLFHRRVGSGCLRVADLQDVDLEPGQDAPLDAFHQAELEQHRPVEGLVVHGRDQAPAGLIRAGTPGSGLPQAGRGRHVQPPRRRHSLLVVDSGPRLAEITRSSVGLVDHQEVEGAHGLAV